MRKIAFNLQPLAASKLTGIGTYAREVARRLGPNLEKGGYASVEIHVFDFLKRNGGLDFVRQHADKPVADMPFKQSLLMPLGAYIRLGKLGSIIPYEKILHTENDLTVFFNYLVPLGLKGKTIITVYDMVCARYPETMDKKNKRLLTKHLPESCKKAEKIMTISEFSKREIMDVLNVPEEKIHVAYCGVNRKNYSPFKDAKQAENAHERIAKKWNVRDGYILYLGTLEPRKNVGLLIDAFEIVKEKYPNLKLVIGGGLGWNYEPIIQKIEGSKYVDDIIRTGYLSESDKIDLYRCANLFAFPSLYEGFGLPVLEAMACGTMVIASDTSSLPEVVGDAGWLSDPHDAGAFAEKMIEILDGNYNSSEMHEKMELQVKKFSWNRTTVAYGQAIYDVIQ
ncbi:MAG: glycosyltransferase family 4 protein [Clostridiales bacterium]|nr:glycosyltransferase family 4 protein [Clostridiales bacterium]